MTEISCLTDFAENYSSTYHKKFLVLYDRKTRCILESGTEMCSTEVEYESSSDKMMATHVYLSFQHVSRVPGLGTLLLKQKDFVYFVILPACLTSFNITNFTTYTGKQI